MEYTGLVRQDKTLGKMLRAWRAQHHLSQSHAAAVLGIPVRTLQGYEQEQRQPRGLAAGVLEERMNVYCVRTCKPLERKP